MLINQESRDLCSGPSVATNFGGLFINHLLSLGLCFLIWTLEGLSCISVFQARGCKINLVGNYQNSKQNKTPEYIIHIKDVCFMKFTFSDMCVCVFILVCAGSRCKISFFWIKVKNFKS